MCAAFDLTHHQTDFTGCKNIGNLGKQNAAWLIRRLFLQA